MDVACRRVGALAAAARAPPRGRHATAAGGRKDHADSSRKLLITLCMISPSASRLASGSETTISALSEGLLMARHQRWNWDLTAEYVIPSSGVMGSVVSSLSSVSPSWSWRIAVLKATAVPK